MDELPLHKIAISGPTLASVIQCFSTSPGAVDGLLFGHVTYVTPSTLSDDSTSNPPPLSPSSLVSSAPALSIASMTPLVPSNFTHFAAFSVTLFSITTPPSLVGSPVAIQPSPAAVKHISGHQWENSLSPPLFLQ